MLVVAGRHLLLCVENMTAQCIYAILHFPRGADD